MDSPIFLESLANGFGADKIAANVDARYGHVAVRGWTKFTSINDFDFILMIEKL